VSHRCATQQLARGDLDASAQRELRISDFLAQTCEVVGVEIEDLDRMSGSRRCAQDAAQQSRSGSLHRCDRQYATNVAVIRHFAKTTQGAPAKVGTSPRTASHPHDRSEMNVP
jgi:hypothetical protein